MKVKIFISMLLTLLLSSCSTKESSVYLIDEQKNSSITYEIIEDYNKDSNDTIIETNATPIKQPFYSFNKEIKIYLNPSVQYANMYYDKQDNEGIQMNKISNILESLLKQYSNITVYSNNSLPGKSLASSVSESNSLNVDYHLSLHSNAGGGKGSEGWHSNTSKEFTQSILNSLNNVLPYTTRGLKNGTTSLYEIKKTTAKASLIEILFHDEKYQAEFIKNNHDAIAKAIFKGIINYFTIN